MAMSFLDADDRAHLALLAPIAARWMALAFATVAVVLLLAVTAGYAVWLFRLTSGY